MADTVALSPAAALVQECPQCHATIPADRRYAIWCDHCNWNLEPQAAPRHLGTLDGIYLRMGRRAGRALLGELLRRPRAGRGLSLARVLAFALALPVHTLTLALCALGIALIARGWPYVAPVFGGGLSLVAAWSVAPRLAPVPRDILPRAQFPALYALADGVARALALRPVDGVVVTGDFNASMGRAGLGRRRILWLGLPLLAVLEPQERVALVAHELTHDAHGDPARSLITGTALRSLARWRDLLDPDVLVGRQLPAAGLGALGDLFGRYLAWLLAFLLRGAIWGYGYVLAHLTWRDTQRAEYQADAVAGQMAGTRALLGLLGRLPLAESYARLAAHVAASRQPRDLFAEFSQRAADLPERELERLRRVELQHGSRLDATHPPTAFRIELARSHPATAAMFALSSASSERIDAELARLAPAMQKQAARLYWRRLYE